MMNRNKFGGLWLGVALMAGTMTAGCGAESSTGTAAGASADTAATAQAATSQDATTMVAQAVESTSDASDAAEAANLMRGLHELRPDAVEAFHCASNPSITHTTVCGKSLPATVHLEWTTCAAPTRPQSGGANANSSAASASSVEATSDGKASDGKGGSGGNAPPAGGGAPPSNGGGSGGNAPPAGGGAPPSNGGSGGGNAPPAGGGAPPSNGGSSGGTKPPEGGQEGGPRFGPSSGKVDIAYTYSAAEDCSGAVTQNQSVTFEISRTDEDGAVSKEQGSTTSSALLAAGAPPQTKATSADVTRTLTDKAGSVVRSVHLKGSQSSAFSNDTPPVRTLNGSYTEDFLDGSSGTVTLTNIVRPPRDVCPWPTSGSLTRASSDNTSHALVFGPECGAATLDGTAVDLTTQRMPDRGPSGGGGGKGGGKDDNGGGGGSGNSGGK